jgi:hypothetical protein
VQAQREPARDKLVRPHKWLISTADTDKPLWAISTSPGSKRAEAIALARRLPHVIS